MAEIVLDTVRRLQAPFAAGLCWALAIWLVLSTGIDPQTSNSATADALDRLSELLGKSGGLILLLFAVVGLGSLSQQILRAPAIWVANATTYLVALIEALIVWLIGLFSDDEKLRRYKYWEPVAVDRARRVIRHHHDEIVAAVDADHLDALEHRLYARVDHLLAEEINDSNPGDRRLRDLEQQAWLRLTIGLPLGVLITVAAIQLSPFFSILAPLPFVVLFQGSELRTQSDAELERIVWEKTELDQAASELSAS